MIRLVESSALGSGSVVQKDESVLSVRGRQVVHHDLGGHTFKTWSFCEEHQSAAASVLQALFVDFPDDDAADKKGSWLAVLVGPELLALYGKDGSQVEMPLPVAASSLWPTSRGLLVSCSQDDSCALSLSHPLDELKLALCSDDTFFQERVVFSQDSMLVSRGKLGSHSFWIAESKASLLSTTTQPQQQEGSGGEEEGGSFGEDDEATPDVQQLALAEYWFRRAGEFERSFSEARAIFVLENNETTTLCLVVDAVLRAFSLNASSEEKFKIEDCADAAPVVEEPRRDTVLLLRDSDRSTLRLYQRHVHVATISLPDCFFSPSSCRGAENDDVVVVVARFSHCSGRGARLSLRDANDDQVARIHVSLCADDRAVQACLDAIDSAAPDAGVALRVEVLSRGGDWAAFSDAVYNMFGIERDPSPSLSSSDDRRRRRCQENDEDLWSTLLQTDYHAQRRRLLFPAADGAAATGGRRMSLARLEGIDEPRLGSGRGDSANEGVRVDAPRDVGVVDDAMLDSITLALHCVCEEWKLNLRTWNLVRPLGILLESVSRESSARLERYRRSVLLESAESRHGDEIVARNTADVHEWFSSLVKHGRCLYALEMPSPGFRTKQLKDIFETMAGAVTSHALVREMIKHGIDDDEVLSTWPPGFALVFREALYAARESPEPSESTTAAFCELVGRQDLAACLVPVESSEKSCLSPGARKEFLSSWLKPLGNDDGDGEFEEEEEFDASFAEVRGECNSGEAGLASSSKIVEREEVACRALDSSRPIYLLVERPPEMSDHDFEQKKQERLFSACLRSCAAPCGRAMLTLGSLGRPSSSMTESLPIPPVCLSGRVPPSNAIISLDAHSVESLGTWLHFHNGVAAGLRLFGEPTNSSACATASSSEDHPVTRTWISYNRPPRPSSEHGGFLLSLGLQNQLHALTMTDIYEYLTLGHDPTTVGILLGMAASKIGTGDTAVSKMLCLHIPALLPQPFAEMEVSATAQAAALTGVGLLYRGTGHRLMTEFLLREISKGIPGDRARDREAYVLSAGIALGMVTLGSGTSPEAAGLVDLRISQRLHRAIVGGRERRRDHGRGDRWKDYSRVDDEDDSLVSGDVLSSSAHRGGAVQGRQPSSKPRGDGTNARCSRVNEGDFVNTAVSAPGATLALGLFFLQTNCRSTAKHIDLPDTHVLLNSLRPDFLLLRVVARSMILWDDVVPSRLWVERQVPAFIQASVKHLREGGIERARSIDWNSIKQAHANVIAGACFSVGLRYAGTGSPSAAETLQHYLKHFKALRATSGVVTMEAATPEKRRDATGTRTGSFSETTSESEASVLRPDRSTVDMALGAVVVALGMVMAGTRDVQSLRLFRDARRRVDKATTFGTHQAIHSAIGLLFLGGGRASLSRSKEAIAALVCAFFPRFPQTADDNQYHLQAARHLWLLAVEWRGLQTVDVNLDEVVPVPLQIGLKDHGVDWASPAAVLEVTAPCLAPPVGDIAWIRIVSERYYPVELSAGNPAHSKMLSSLRLFVKRRSGHLSHVQDPPKEKKALSLAHRVIAESVPGRGGGSGKHPTCADVVAPYTEDAVMAMFARLFCADLVSSSTSLPRARPLGGVPGGCTSNWNAQALYECVAADKQHILAIYLQLHHYAQQLKTHSTNDQAQQAWSLRLMLDYYDRDSCLIKRLQCPTSKTSWLLRPTFIEAIRVHLDSLYGENTVGEEASSSLSAKSSSLSNSSRGCQSILAGVLLPACMRHKKGRT